MPFHKLIRGLLCSSSSSEEKHIPPPSPYPGSLSIQSVSCMRIPYRQGGVENPLLSTTRNKKKDFFFLFFSYFFLKQKNLENNALFADTAAGKLVGFPFPQRISSFSWDKKSQGLQTNSFSFKITIQNWFFNKTARHSSYLFIQLAGVFFK